MAKYPTAVMTDAGTVMHSTDEEVGYALLLKVDGTIEVGRNALVYLEGEDIILRNMASLPEFTMLVPPSGRVIWHLEDGTSHEVELWDFLLPYADDDDAAKGLLADV